MSAGAQVPPASPRWPFPAACLAALLLMLGAYSNSFRNAFHFDDVYYIVDNLHIRDVRNIPSFFVDARTYSTFEVNATYRPVAGATFAIDYFLGGGLDPVAFHITQLVLFAAVGVCLFLLLVHLFRTVAPTAPWPRWAALFGAALFCLHTGNTQTGNYISARTELLSGLGVLAAFVVYVYWPLARRWHLYLLPLVFGALAKQPAVLFGALLLFYKLLIEERLSARDLFRRNAWPRVRRGLVGSIPALVAGALLFVFVEAMNPPSQSYSGGARLPYLITQTWMWVRYVGLFLVPVGLTADSDLGIFPTWRDARVLAGVVLLASSLFAAWRASARPTLRPVAFGIAWFWIALAPTSSIFTLGEVTNDHRVFFPFMGLVLAAVGWAAVLVYERTPAPGSSGVHVVPAARNAALLAAAVLVLGAHAVGTHRRNEVWRNDETLWGDVVAKSPRNGRGLMNYGLSQMRRGRLDVAKEHFLRAGEINPNYPFLEINLGILEGARSDTMAAERHFLRALALDPQLATGHRHYGRFLVSVGRAPEALPHLERAIALATGDVESRRLLMGLLAALGDAEEARLAALARETLQIDRADRFAAAYAAGEPPFEPAQRTSQGWMELGVEATSRGDHVGAAQAYRRVLAIDGTHAEAWNNLGWSLGQLGFSEEAGAAFAAALRYRPDFELAANNLAWLSGAAATRRFQEAFELQNAGAHADAIAVYRELLTENPGWVNARYNLGYSLMEQGDCAAAVTELERVLGLDPSVTAAHLHLSTCLAALGRSAEAERHRAQYEREPGSR